MLRFPKEVNLPTRLQIHPHLYKRTNYISKPKSPERKKLKKIREVKKLKKEKLKQFKENSLKKNKAKKAIKSVVTSPKRKRNKSKVKKLTKEKSIPSSDLILSESNQKLVKAKIEKLEIEAKIVSVMQNVDNREAPVVKKVNNEEISVMQEVEDEIAPVFQQGLKGGMDQHQESTNNWPTRNIVTESVEDQIKFVNTGTDCFVNSSLQFFRKMGFMAFLKRELLPVMAHLNDQDYTLSKMLVNLFSDTTRQPVETSMIRSLVAIESRKPDLDRGTQEDAEEFLRSLIEIISKEFNKSLSFGDIKEKHCGSEKRTKIFLDNPSGSCRGCDQYSTSEEMTFFFLKLRIPSSQSSISISSLIDSYFSEGTERLRMKCSTCCVHQQNGIPCPQTGFCNREAVNKTELIKAPEYLCVQLIRYDDFGKVITEVNIEEVLIFNNNSYEPICLLNHIGTQRDQGHYVTHSKTDSGKWMLYDDNDIYLSSLKQANSNENYLVLFKKKNASISNEGRSVNDDEDNTDTIISVGTSNKSEDNTKKRKHCNKNKELEKSIKCLKTKIVCFGCQKEFANIESHFKGKIGKKCKLQYYEQENMETNVFSTSDHEEIRQGDKSKQSEEKGQSENMSTSIEIKCKGCGNKFKKFLRHVSSKSFQKCKPNYSTEELKVEIEKATENAEIKKKESHQKYRQTKSGKEALKRYQQSKNGKQKLSEATQRYQQTESGQQKLSEATQTYQQTESGKERTKRYQQTESGKERTKRYQQTESGKERTKRYQQTESGQQKLSEATQRYQQTEIAKEAKKRYRETDNAKVKQRESKKRFAIKKILTNFETDTGFNNICCYCNQYKSFNGCSKISTLNEEEQMEYLKLDERFNKSKDNEFYICHYCLKKIKEGKAQKKEEKMDFHLEDFPKEFLNEVKQVTNVDEVLFRNMENLGINDPDYIREKYEKEALKLNKLEDFILKIILPFVRVAHCKRGPYLMVKGNLVLISNDIDKSLSKIVPNEQQLLPVSFKRKMQYKGAFLEEWIDVEKVKMYFSWFKENNPHYEDIELSEEMIQHFEKETMKSSMEFEKLSNQSTSSKESSNEEDKNCQSEKDFISKEVLDELYNSENDDDEEENSPFAHEKNIKMDQTSMFMDKYESDVNLPSVANRMANLIINFEKNNQIDYVVEDEVEHEQSENEDTSDDEGFNINEYGIVITLEQVHNIQPQNCFIEALYFFDILTDDLKECKHNHQ